MDGWRLAYLGGALSSFVLCINPDRAGRIGRGFIGFDSHTTSNGDFINRIYSTLGDLSKKAPVDLLVFWNIGILVGHWATPGSKLAAPILAHTIQLPCEFPARDAWSNIPNPVAWAGKADQLGFEWNTCDYPAGRMVAGLA